MPTAKRSVKVAPDVLSLPEGTSMGKRYPLIEEGMVLTEEVLARDWSQRPMVWSDLPLFEARHGRNAHDMVYDLGMHQANHYRARIGLHEVLPYDIELLVRLYDRYPSSCQWQCPSLPEMFMRIYGPAIDGFAPNLQERAKKAYGMRFARLMGRAPTVQYRWLWDGSMQDKSGSTRRIRNIICKLHEAAERGDSPRVILEDLGVRIWALRGLNVDAQTPAYDPIAMQKKGRPSSRSQPQPQEPDETNGVKPRVEGTLRLSGRGAQTDSRQGASEVGAVKRSARPRSSTRKSVGHPLRMTHESAGTYAGGAFLNPVD